MSRTAATVTLVLLLAPWALGQRTLPAGPASPFDAAGVRVPETPIDRLVQIRLRQLRVESAPVCSDAVFLRRVYLDVIGTIPTAEEARTFLADREPDKRKQLIDRLLGREEFPAYWAMKWSDLLRVKAEFPINLWPNAAQAYHQWIEASLRDNKPYDQFARELLTASGSNFRVPPANFYRAVQSKEPAALAQTVALTFLGQRADKWPAERLTGMAAFFSQVGSKATLEWKEEIVFFDPSKPFKGPAVFPDGTPATIAAGQDPRGVFADWLVRPKNPWFARGIANRVWSWLLGRGIVHEPDDLRPDNPPVHPEVLAYLEQELVAHQFDLKHLYRLILNSQTYQRSAIPRSTDPKAEALFAHYPVRRLEAEVLADVLGQITGASDTYTSAIPEPFTFIPQDQRSVALPDGSITSSFLDLFGRSARDTGLESERNLRPTAAQRLHLLNSSHVQRRLEGSRLLQSLAQSRKSRKEMVNEIYLAVLSRYPTEDELRAVADYGESHQGREALVDLTWALINST
jgi:hypothetical protein